MAAIILERQGVGQAATGEDQPLLPCEIGDLVDAALRLGMRAAVQKASLKQLSGLAWRNGPVADAAGSRFHFDKRFKPEESARSGANKLDVEAATTRLVSNCVCDKVCADG